MTHRFYSAQLPDAGSVTLDGLEAHHLLHVLRASPGSVVELFDGRGLIASAEVVAVRKRDAELRIVDSRREAPPVREIVLGTAVPKGDRFDWLIEKATELNVTKIVPLTTARSVVDPRDSKLDKLRQTVVTACKQCGRNYLLELSAVTSWNDFVQNEFRTRTAFLAHPGGLSSDCLSEPDSDLARVSVVLAVGPEGGFTDDEVALAVAAGARTLSLGPLILRIETAALALAARFGLG
jgi:16S rRNA (uracil1498-N3)-methyltransferase